MQWFGIGPEPSRWKTAN